METPIDFIDTRKLSVISSNKRPSRKVSEHEPATFEEAIEATKFGRYNITLALLTMISALCAVFDTSTMSYTFIVAQCDLNLTLSDKGLLNGMVYAGMISSAMMWGFLFDVLGRRKLLIFGYLVDALFVFTSALSQSLPLLLAMKYFQGFIISGPMAAISSYTLEFHSAKYRPIYQMLIGSCNSFGTVLVPILAWLILPRNMDFSIMNLNFHSWNVFLLISGLPAFFSGMIFIFFPESPKFLMMCGENEKALEVFKKVYRINTGCPPDTYPIKHLIDETKLNIDTKHGGYVTSHRTQAQALREGFQQIRPLFMKPHLWKLIHTCILFLFINMSMNTLRLWLPQIFQIMTDYELEHDESASLCTMLETVSAPVNSTTDCTVNLDNATVYINSIIVGITGILGNILAGTLIRFSGKKKILISALIVAGSFCISMYFAKTPDQALAFSSIFIATASVSNNVMVSVDVDLFPTTLRTMAIAFGVMISRLGAMFGNYSFSYLLESGCGAPFFVIGGTVLVAAVISLALPNTDMMALT